MEFLDRNALFVNENEVPEAASTAVSSYSYKLYTGAEAGKYDVLIKAQGAEDTVDLTFSYNIITASREAPLPAGIVKGINYDDQDDTKVTLCLLAPNKSSVHVIGDFNDWTVSPDYQLSRDGELFWITISDLTAEQEYAFQYVVDGSIYIADPYADKVLDPLDVFIPETIYPNLKPFPEGAERALPYSNVVSVFQTGQQSYDWQVNDFERPDPAELVVYELLIRDFFDNGQESYQHLIDTLSYLKSLGINAIQLMPVTEFNGNDSWGYNPTFMFAVDKAYGPKNDLKDFIDAAHGLGMAMILDMVINHQDQPMPYVLMDYDGAPTEDNVYFNRQPTHPFNVFFDMNHESAYTQEWADSVNRYWVAEYRFDGYRFDLSKGFTQTNYGGDVGAWSSYDAGRVALLKRMADKLWAFDPGVYFILEHFADNTEERELGNYGMMSWGNLHGAYKQNMLGFASNSNIDWIYHGTRGWNDPHVVGYMESHDEERQMYEALEFGNSSGDYDIKNLENALARMEAAFAMMLLVPGPKMIWQFGEMGYDISINDNGRTGQKPNPWANEGLDYYNDPARSQLRHIVSELIHLKTSYPVFQTGEAVFPARNDLSKVLIIENPDGADDPAAPDQMSAVVIANFDVLAKNIRADFPHGGGWYDYFNESSFTLTAPGPRTFALAPGEFRLFTNYRFYEEVVSGVEGGRNSDITLYPNPAQDFIKVSSNTSEPLYYFIYDLQGKQVNAGKFSDKVFETPTGMLRDGSYIMEIITRKGNRHFVKFNKK